ncbi:hypothetical protein SEVIR_9G206855v4 [Setaria viridis]
MRATDSKYMNPETCQDSVGIRDQKILRVPWPMASLVPSGRPSLKLYGTLLLTAGPHTDQTIDRSRRRAPASARPIGGRKRRAGPRHKSSNAEQIIIINEIKREKKELGTDTVGPITAVPGAI